MLPTTPVRGTTAKEVFARSDRKIFQDIIYEQIKVIDTTILNTHKAGYDCVVHDLPITFPIFGSMQKADAQAIVYSELLLIYKTPEPNGKGYNDVTILMDGVRNQLRIRWVNGITEDERARRLKIINDCIVRK